MGGPSASHEAEDHAGIGWRQSPWSKSRTMLKLKSQSELGPFLEATSRSPFASCTCHKVVLEVQGALSCHILALATSYSKAQVCVAACVFAAYVQEHQNRLHCFSFPEGRPAAKLLQDRAGFYAF